MDQNNVDAVWLRSESGVHELRSLVAELFTALTNTLNDQRDSAEDSLTRVAAMLRATGMPVRKTTDEFRGRLAPWQVRKVTAYVESHLDGPLRSGEIAKLVRLSAGHFSRTFRSSFGCSPLEYVTRRRIERAQGLMLSTDTPLAQIALECGLSDQAHFSRLFRRVVGESPRDWRRARVSGARVDVDAQF